MVGAEDWLFRPVDRGYLRYTDLIDGTVDLADVAVCNDAIDVIEENRWRAQEAYKEQNNK